MTLITAGIGIGASEYLLLRCNSGQTDDCYRVKPEDSGRISNKDYLARLDREKEEDRRRRKVREDLAAQAAKTRAEEEARFRSEGWFEAQPGIYARWCDDCNGSEAYMDYHWRMEVWCKERACGDIYARINIKEGSDGPIVAWTNETGYGDLGQRVILTFQSATPGSASLTEFIARG